MPLNPVNIPHEMIHEIGSYFDLDDRHGRRSLAWYARTHPNAHEALQPFLNKKMLEDGGFKVLNWACNARSHAIVDNLVTNFGVSINMREPGSPGGPTALHYASWLGRTEVIKFLLRKGANQEAVALNFAPDPRTYSKERQRMASSIVDILPVYKYMKPIHCAVEADRPKATQLFIDHGASLLDAYHTDTGYINHDYRHKQNDIEVQMCSMLHRAAFDGHFEQLELLLAAGMSPNLQQTNNRSRGSNTPMHFVLLGQEFHEIQIWNMEDWSDSQHLKCFEALRNKGGDLGVRNHEQLNLIAFTACLPSSKNDGTLLKFVLTRGPSNWAGKFEFHGDSDYEDIEYYLDDEGIILRPKTPPPKEPRPTVEYTESEKEEFKNLITEAFAQTIITNGHLRDGTPAAEFHKRYPTTLALRYLVDAGADLKKAIEFAENYSGPTQSSIAHGNPCLRISSNDRRIVVAKLKGIELVSTVLINTPVKEDENSRETSREAAFALIDVVQGQLRAPEEAAAAFTELMKNGALLAITDGNFDFLNDDEKDWSQSEKQRIDAMVAGVQLMLPDWRSVESDAEVGGYDASNHETYDSDSGYRWG